MVMGVSRGGLARAWCCRWSERRVGWQERTLTGHSRMVLSVAFSRDGKWIVSGSVDKLVKIWDAETGAEVSSFAGGRWGSWGEGEFCGGFAQDIRG